MQSLSEMPELPGLFWLTALLRKGMSIRMLQQVPPGFGHLGC